MNRTIPTARADISPYAPTPFEIEVAIDDVLDLRWAAARHRPHLSHMEFEGQDDGWSELKFTIELDGLELPFEKPDADVMALLHGGLEEFAASVAAVCADVLSHSLELREAQSAMRRRVEEFCRELAVGGVEVPLLWLSLAPHDHWVTPADVRFDIALAGLGHSLRADEIMGEAGLDDDLCEAFDHALDTQRERARQVAEIRSVGAHGRADALALALIAANPHPLDAFRDVTSHDRIDLQDGVSLHWSNGVLRSSGDLPGNAAWYHDRVELPGRWFSAAAAAAMVGRPASDIVDHPAFAGVSISEVASEVMDGRTATFIGLEAPVAFFNASAGRSWPDSATGPW